MKKVLFLIVVAIIATSCVSKDDYDSAKRESRNWQNSYSDLQQEYFNLKAEYNELVDKYNQLQGQYNYLYNDNAEKNNIIIRAKSATSGLSDCFDRYQAGFISAQQFRNEIDDVEDILNGWY